ncbi:MAG: DUF748 domain-containing protein [Methylovulum sp.]
MEIKRLASYIVKPWIIVSSLLIIAVIAGFYSLPVLLKSYLPQIIQDQTGRKASIEAIEIDLFPVRLALHGFEIQEKNGQPFAAFDEFFVEVDTSASIKQTALVINNLRLKKPFVHIAQEKNGAFNFQELVKEDTEPQAPDSELFPVTIAKLSLSEGKLAWEDLKRDKPVKEIIDPINLELESFTTQTDQPFKLILSLALGAGHLEWNGAAGIRSSASEGHIKFDKVQLESLLALVAPAMNIKGTGLLETDYKVSYIDNHLKLTANAKLELQNFQYVEQGQVIKVPVFSHQTDLNFSYADNSWQLEANKARINSSNIELAGLVQNKVLVNIPVVNLETAYKLDSGGKQLNFIVNKAKFDSRDVRLTESGQAKPLVKIPVIALTGIDFNLNDQALTVESVSAKDADINAWLNPDGVVNYQTLFAAPKIDQAPPKPPEPEGTPWKINIKNIALNNFSGAFEDRTLKKPTIVNFKGVNFKLTDYSNKTGVKLPFKLDVGVNKTGVIKLSGDTVLDPLTANTNIDIKDIELEKFQPYYDKFVRLDVIDGGLNIAGNLAIAETPQDKLDVKFNGNAGIADLLTRDQKVNKDLVKWENFTLKGIAVDLLANRYIAASLDIDRPYARVTIRKDKTVNFSNIVIGATDTGTTDKPVKIAANKPVKANEPYFNLGKIQIIDGSSDFTDLSLILPFAAHIKSLDGGASGVSSEKKSVVKVALKGNAYDLSPVDIKGEISPYLGDYNVEVNFTGLPMPLISPYMVQFAGYKVENGKLTLGLNYRVVDNKLTSSNSILIDQFELGEKVENPDAVSIPLKLAVALLKDSSGKIKFDVPITGSLEDPEFNLGAIITDTLFNVITKIVSSPFNAIASLLGGDEKSFSTVNFTAGNLKLEKAEYEKLDKLSQALKERPVLSLQIKGAAFQDQDWPAIRDDALFDQLKKRRADEINKESSKKIRPEYVELSDQDYKRLLAELFIEKFPLLAEKSLFGKPQLKDLKSGDFYEIAKQKLFQIIKPEEERLKELAAARAQAVAKYMIQKGGVPHERIFILDTAIDPQREGNQIATVLSLKAE